MHCRFTGMAQSTSRLRPRSLHRDPVKRDPTACSRRNDRSVSSNVELSHPHRRCLGQMFACRACLSRPARSAAHLGHIPERVHQQGRSGPVGCWFKSCAGTSLIFAAIVLDYECPRTGFAGARKANRQLFVLDIEASRSHPGGLLSIGTVDPGCGTASLIGPDRVRAGRDRPSPNPGARSCAGWACWCRARSA